MQSFLYIITIPFLYYNYKIIISDIKNKIIPNKYLRYLLLLVPFYYIYIFLNFNEINYLSFLLQIFLTFIISFILYYFGVWAAGDAKYLLILSLFIPKIGIIPFIGNIALITLIYLFLYFIYFYTVKISFNKNYKKKLLKNIKQDLSEIWKIYKYNKGGKTYKIVIKFLLIFFIIFISIRLFRIYLFNNILDNGNTFYYFSEIITKYNIYLLYLFIGIFIGGLILFKIIINNIKLIIVNKFKININLVENILIFILFLCLISFIFYEYNVNSYEIQNYLLKIFTIYLIIYLIVKILIYSYKITFGISEYKYININNLKKEDIIDKNDFNKKIIPNLDNDLQNLNISTFQIKGNIILNKKNLYELKQIIKIINKKDRENYDGKSQIYGFNCLNTFSFGGYIFLGFIITFLFNNKIINYIIQNILIFIKNFTN